MYIGVPKEVKNHEYRVGLTPNAVKELVSHGHTLVVENNAGLEIGFTNEQYVQAGAGILETAGDVFAKARMIVKVKEPQPDECKMLREDQILFTYLHLAADLIQTDLLMKSGARCIAYETVTDAEGRLPLLIPMSEVAGRMATQAGAHCLEKAQGGNGTLLGGVTGVAPAKVLVIGGGVVGDNAATVACGMGAEVTILDQSIARLRELDIKYKRRIKCLYSTIESIDDNVRNADLVVGAVLLPGGKAPKLLSASTIAGMKPGSVVVDVAIDQGGCFETSRATTHDDPTYIVDGVVHYCVTNMPGAVAKTSTIALNNATLPYVLEIADKGFKQALSDNIHLAHGLNIYQGKITHQAVADAHGYEFVDPIQALTHHRA